MVTSSEDFKNRLFAHIKAELSVNYGSITPGDSVKKRGIGVVAYIASDVLSGYIALPEDKRLSDFLNSPSQFIKLTDVTILSAEGKPEILPEIHINKEAIKMIRTADKNTARGTGPSIPKIPVRTYIHMPDFELDGMLHCKKTESVMQLLETDSTFLPCTAVSVHDFQTNDSWHTGFAAINRKLVSTLHQAQ